MTDSLPHGPPPCRPRSVVAGAGRSASCRRTTSGVPVNLSRDNARLLTVAFEAYARQASHLLTSALRRCAQVELLSVDQVSYAEYVDSLHELTYLTMFSVEPLPQKAVLETRRSL